MCRHGFPFRKERRRDASHRYTRNLRFAYVIDDDLGHPIIFFSLSPFLLAAFMILVLDMKVLSGCMYYPGTHTPHVRDNGEHSSRPTLSYLFFFSSAFRYRALSRRTSLLRQRVQSEADNAGPNRRFLAPPRIFARGCVWGGGRDHLAKGGRLTGPKGARSLRRTVSSEVNGVCAAVALSM